jgi:5-methyltetrahydrofolate--homocysteine methyltransferase
LERHGLVPKLREINKAGAAITREVCGEKAIAAGDIGPSGKLFVMGEVSEEDLFEAFAEQAAALKEGGAGCFVVESMMDAGEMGVAVRAAAETGLPVIASMTYEKTPTGYRTVMGNSPEEAVQIAVSAGASVIGANCGSGIDSYIDIVPVFRKLTDLPVWIKGNAGLPELVDGKPVYRMDPGSFASHAEKLLEGGAMIIGGCCGTSPEFIKKLRTLVDAWNRHIPDN